MSPCTSAPSHGASAFVFISRKVKTDLFCYLYSLASLKLCPSGELSTEWTCDNEKPITRDEWLHILIPLVMTRRNLSKCQAITSVNKHFEVLEFDDDRHSSLTGLT